MKRVLAALAAILLLVVPLSAARPFDTVTSFGGTMLDMNPLSQTFGQEVERPWCTAFAINEQVHYWMLARHCIEAGSNFFLSDEQIPAEVAAISQEIDVAIVWIPQLHVRHPKAIQLAKHGARTGQKVVLHGFPYLVSSPITTKGYIANDRFEDEDGSFLYALDIAAAPGNSGSPLLDTSGRLLGVLVSGYSPGSLCFAEPWEFIKAEFARFFTTKEVLWS